MSTHTTIEQHRAMVAELESGLCAIDKPVTAPIIAISGRLRSGKSTLARVIARQSTTRESSLVPFAAPLKEAAYYIGWDGKKDVKGRRLLQLLGTEVGRECIDPDIWVKKWKALSLRLLEEVNGHRVVLVDDLRFPNEAKAILEAGGLLVKIKRPSAEPDPIPWWKFWKKHKDHVSEIPLPDELFHYIIENDGLVSDLVPIADQLAKKVQSLYGEKLCSSSE